MNILKLYLKERMDFVSPSNSIVNNTGDNGNVLPEKTLENSGIVSFGEYLDKSGNIVVTLSINDNDISDRSEVFFKKDKSIVFYNKKPFLELHKVFYDQNEINEWKRNISTFLNSIYLST